MFDYVIGYILGLEIMWSSNKIKIGVINFNNNEAERTYPQP